MEENKTEKVFPRAGTKKAKAWELFAQDLEVADIASQIEAQVSTVRTWKNAYKKQKV